MVRWSITALLLASAAGIATAQWTAIPNDPSVWAYGDSIFTPTDTQVLYVYRTFNTFANNKFYVLGGRSGITPYKELGYWGREKNWATDNRHSKASIYDPVTDAWETAGAQALLVASADTAYNDPESLSTLDDLTGVIFPGDWIKCVAEDGSGTPTGACYGKVLSVVYDLGLCIVTFERTYWFEGVCEYWIGGPTKFYRVSTVGLTGLNDSRDQIAPFESHGYQAYTNSTAAWDQNGDGVKEIFLFNGYPHWIPNNVDIYDPAANSWRRGGGDIGTLVGGIDVQRMGGAQEGQYFYWITWGDDSSLGPWWKVFRYDLQNEQWAVQCDLADPSMSFMRNVEVIGNTMYVFWGWVGGDPLTTLVVDLFSGNWVKKTPPPVTGNQCSTIKYGKYILLFGGRTGSGAASATDAIQIYDTENDTWTVSPVTCPYKATTPAVGLAPDGTIYYADGLDETVTWRNWAYKTHISQIIPTAVSVSGTLGLEFHLNPALVTGTLQVYSPFGGGLIETKSLTLDGSGNFNVDLGVSPGTYDLRFGAPNYLWKRLTNVNLSSGPNNVGTVNLTCGDGNANNQIDLGDLNQVLINFGGTGAGDYDGSGSVGLADLNIVLVNFGKTGDN
ncbi:MAG: hypothetical protein AMXMBFR61_06460 [Fimbriimonadales bacterium]